MVVLCRTEQNALNVTNVKTYLILTMRKVKTTKNLYDRYSVIKQI